MKPWWAGRAWAMEQSALRALLAYEPRDGGSADAEPKPYAVHAGVAHVRVSGPLMREVGFWGALFGATGYLDVARQVRMADLDPDVEAIRLVIDSPGGEVSGVQDAARAVADATKTVEAHAVGLCCSAAYWIASQADRIVADPTAMVGSIGVYVSVWDPKSPDVFDFVAAGSPNKRQSPRTEEGAAAWQSQVDDFAALFFADVAAGRGLTAEQVPARYGAGACFAAARALERGLVDALTYPATTHVGAEERREDEPMGTRPSKAAHRGAVKPKAAKAAEKPDDELEPDEMEEGQESTDVEEDEASAMEDDGTGDGGDDEAERLRQENDELRQRIAELEEQLNGGSEGAGASALVGARVSRLEASNQQLRQELLAMKRERMKAERDAAIDGLLENGLPPYLAEAARGAYLEAHKPDASTAAKASWQGYVSMAAAGPTGGSGVPLASKTHGGKLRKNWDAMSAAEKDAQAAEEIDALQASAPAEYPNFEAAADAWRAQNPKRAAEVGL